MTEAVKIDDGGPAFAGGLFEPQHGGSNDREPWNPGMSLREYYAGKALSGIIQLRTPMAADPSIAARAALEYADALIAALKAGA